jgi:hypothetical protein
MNSNRVIPSLVTAVAFIGLAVALKFAEKGGLISHETSVRAFQVVSGLTLAVYANFIPKKLGVFRNAVAAELSQSVLRTGGMAFMLGGLGYALTSALPVPGLLPVIILGTATAYVLGYAVWAIATCPARTGGSASQS